MQRNLDNKSLYFQVLLFYNSRYREVSNTEGANQLKRQLTQRTSKMLNPLEISLFKAVAFDPISNAKLIVSPQSGKLREWSNSALAKKVFGRIAELVLDNKTVSLLAIATCPTITGAELDYLQGIWIEGKRSSAIDVAVVMDALKNEYVIRESNREMDSCRLRNKQEPAQAIRHVGELSVMLNILTHDGISYNPDPTTHLNDTEVTINGSWHCDLFDKLFDGGVPTGGYALCVAPTGFGKTCLSKSYVTYSIISKMPVVICTNEMQAGDIARGVKRALMTMWAGSREESDIEKDMRLYMKVYDRVFDWEYLDRIANWEDHRILVVDSLDNLTYPPDSRSMPIDEKHKARANGIAGLSLKYGSFISVVGNASGEQQGQLRNGVDNVNSARAFGSTWYENLSYWSFVMSRDKVQGSLSWIKRCKNRRKGYIGEVWPMAYDAQGSYYRDPIPVTI